MKSFQSFILSLLATISFQSHALADDQGNDVETGANGGIVQSVGELTVEMVIKDAGILILFSDGKGSSIAASDASGSLTFKIEDKPKEYILKLQPLKNGGLGAAIDLTKLKGKILHMNVTIYGLEDPSIVDQALEFHMTGKLSDTLSDELLISLQKTCPVTGKSLGSMGKPPKIMIDGKPLFVCCEPCSERAKSKSEEYLKKYYSDKGKEVRPGVFEATLADAVAIASQKNCPVMDEELGGMGVPQKVNVNGKSIYICCAGCAKKLISEPEKYLAMLAERGVTPPDFE